VVRPRHSWIIASPRRDQKQTAYHILVAGSEAMLKAGKGDLWNSGKIASDQTAHVVYTGKPLQSRMRCFWKVRVWDGDGRPSAWSDPATWTMGLIEEKDWRAEWIGYDAPVEAAKKAMAESDTPDGPVLPPPRYLRKDFDLGKPIRRATLYATALGIYEVRVNGHRVGDDYFTPGWTDYNTRVYYHTYDATDLLREGGNAIGAVLADGWYAGHLGWKSNSREHYGDKIRLRAQLEVEYADGSTRIIATDPTWKAAIGPLIEADFFMGETHDARREMTGWDAPGFEDSAWTAVDLASQVDPMVQAHPGVPVREFAEIKPVSMTEPQEGRFVFDMGQNFAGFVRLNVTAPNGEKIVMRFAERLNPDGTIYTTNLRRARATDTYICRGEGEEIWQPRFTFHGFQYVEVTGYPGRPGPDAITGIALSSKTPIVGSFKCSDEMANQLYSNIRWTQWANFIDIPTDCPQRDERMGWTGDAQVYIRTATYNANVAAFFTKWLVDLEDAQSAEGGFPDVAPRKIATDVGTAAWADAGVICPWTIYEVYGDKRVLERHYESMARWIAYCTNNSEGLLRPDKGYGDWLSIQADTPKDVLATAYFAYSTKLMARCAEVLGKTDDAARHHELFERIKAAFNKAWVHDDGRIEGETQTVYVLALAFDLLPEAVRPLAAEHLLENIQERDGHLSTGFIGTKNLMGVLNRIGRADVAYALFHNDTFPSWGFSIRHGATSIWERWDGWTPDKGFQDPGMNSFAHYSFGAVAQWMFQTIAGIDSDGAGFKRIIIHPRPGGRLHAAKASYHSIRGPIATEWKLQNGDYLLDVEIPANTTAIVIIPAAGPNVVTESGWPAGEAEGVRFLRMDQDEAVYEIGSGSYRFFSRGAESLMPFVNKAKRN